MRSVSSCLCGLVRSGGLIYSKEKRRDGQAFARSVRAVSMAGRAAPKDFTRAVLIVINKRYTKSVN